MDSTQRVAQQVWSIGLLQMASAAKTPAFPRAECHRQNHEALSAQVRRRRRRPRRLSELWKRALRSKEAQAQDLWQCQKCVDFRQQQVAIAMSENLRQRSYCADEDWASFLYRSSNLMIVKGRNSVSSTSTVVEFGAQCQADRPIHSDFDFDSRQHFSDSRLLPDLGQWR